MAASPVDARLLSEEFTLRRLLLLALPALLLSCQEETPHAVVFKLVNTGPCVTYLQISGGRHLSVSKDGRSVQIEHSCSTCLCDACGNCAVCGMEAATVKRLAPGEFFEHAWDGRAWFAGTDCGQRAGCEWAGAAGRGTYLAKVEFGSGTDSSQVMQATVTGAVSIEKLFEHGREQTVEIALDTKAFQSVAGSECPGILPLDK